MSEYARRFLSDDAPERTAYLDVELLALRGLGVDAPLAATASARTVPVRTVEELRRLRGVASARIAVETVATTVGAVLVFGVVPASALLIVGLGLLLVGAAAVAFDLAVVLRLQRALAARRLEASFAPDP